MARECDIEARSCTPKLSCLRSSSVPSASSPLQIHWFLPTGGDSRDILPTAENAHRRPPSPNYLAQIAQACDSLGFGAVLTPCGTGCEDSWIATATLAAQTQQLKYLVAFRPGLLNPTVAAQMASTYQRMTGGRLLINIVIGAEEAELQRFGDFTPKDDRYRRAGEFLSIVKQAWSDEPVDFDGDFYSVRGATTRLAPNPRPLIYFGGASEAAEIVAAEHVDVYLAWGETPEMVAPRIERMRERAQAAGRDESNPLKFGIRFHVITRDTSEEAWQEAGRLLSGIDSDSIAAARKDFENTQSVGQKRMAELSNLTLKDGETATELSDPRAFEIYPNVWAGVGLVRGGAGTALVGSHSEVADRIEEYQAIGFDEFILSGYPHLEEAYMTGEGLLPELRRRGLLAERPEADEPIFSFR